jgi:hypothetical protein
MASEMGDRNESLCDLRAVLKRDISPTSLTLKQKQWPLRRPSLLIGVPTSLELAADTREVHSKKPISIAHAFPLVLHVTAKKRPTTAEWRSRPTALYRPRANNLWSLSNRLKNLELRR